LVAGLLKLMLASGAAQRIALDLPNDRSLHAAPVPRVGGLVLMVVAAAVLWFAAPTLRAMVSAGAVVMLVSAWDDRRGLPVVVRFGTHLAAALFITYSLLSAPPVWLLVIAVLALTWGMNLYNFMDGSDGLAGGMAVIGFSAMGAAAATASPDLAAGGFCIAAAAAGFLVHNFHPARVFMGDAGSVPLGFLAGALGLAGWTQGIWPPWFPVLVFSPFIVDASVTLASRIARGEKPWQAHREHAYQRMVAGGLGHRGTALIWYALMGCCALSAILALRLEASAQQIVFGSWAAIYIVLLAFVYKRFPHRRA
jgi:UDP-N-acetylmuramyl pentapeptide phosphotransferase/UDP-N-acetylglucosamine-1-phosphate transferase